jgi:hypothetical protein
MQDFDPIDLFTHKRLDLIIRFRYALHFFSEWRTFAASDYIKFMKLLSGNQNINERDLKYSPANRLRSFDNLILSITTNGFQGALEDSPILVSKGGHVLNGAHRVAAAKALNISNITCLQDENPQKEIFTTDCESLRKMGFSRNSAEGLLLDALNISKKSRFMLLFAGSEKYATHLHKEVSSFAEVIYQFGFRISRDGLRRLVEVAYHMNDWWTPSYIDEILREKLGESDVSRTGHIIVYQPNSDVIDVREFKLLVREKLELKGMNGRQLHGSDQWSDTKAVLEVLLSEGGRFFLNNGPYGSERSLMERLQSEVTAAGPDPTSITLAGSTVLELHGLRKARDIDFFSLKPPEKDTFDWGCRNYNFDYSSEDVWNACRTQSSFVFKGFRFQSLEMYLRYQEHRRITSKGKFDYNLANILLKKESSWQTEKREKLYILVRQIKYGVTIFVIRTYPKFVRKVPAPIRRLVKWLLPKKHY